MNAPLKQDADASPALDRPRRKFADRGMQADKTRVCRGRDLMLIAVADDSSRVLPVTIQCIVKINSFASEDELTISLIFLCIRLLAVVIYYTVGLLTLAVEHCV